MANMASVAYAIEGPEEVLQKIYEAIMDAYCNDDGDSYQEYKAAKKLKLHCEEGKTRLRGDFQGEPRLENEVLRFSAEEAWGLQDFNELLKKKFPKIKVYWVVEESGCEVYCTNDREGKYFPERYWVDTCIDGIYDSEYFRTEGDVYKWLDKLTYGRVKSKEDVEKFNADYEDSEASDENFIYIHEFEVE